MSVKKAGGKMNFDIDEMLCCGKVPSQDDLLPREFREKYGLGKIHQLGLAVPDVSAAAKRLEEKGLGPFLVAEDDLALWIERGENKSFHGKLGMAFLGGYELELLEEGRGSTVYSECFREDGLIALHHVGLLDHNLEDRMKQFNDAGLETGVRAKIKLGPLTIDVAYMDAREEVDMYVEFIDYRLAGIPITPTPIIMKSVARLLRLLRVRELRMGQCD